MPLPFRKVVWRLASKVPSVIKGSLSMSSEFVGIFGEGDDEGGEDGLEESDGGVKEAQAKIRVDGGELLTTLFGRIGLQYFWQWKAEKEEEAKGF